MLKGVEKLVQRRIRREVASINRRVERKIVGSIRERD